ncbi:MAG: methionine--tRNA ligase [bacterium]
MSYDNNPETQINLSDNTPILVAVAWPYVNGDIHVGHIAGCFLSADIFARYNRLKGRPVLMVSGSDCHGTPITVAADKEKVTPQEIVDKYHPKVLNLIKTLEIEYELYTKTTTENHYKITQDLFVALAKNGYISKKVTPQYYSEKDNKFLPDRYVEGTCPFCGFEDSRSDQCDKCSSVIEEGKLIKPRSKNTGSPVEFKDTEHYFLDLDKFQLELENFVENKSYWREWVLAETKGWLKRGLYERSITRDLDWGIPIPTDRLPDELKLDGAENKRFYVWFDAVIGYLSASVEWSDMHKDNDGNLPKPWLDWKHYWYNEDARHYYFMGKDNLFFHTISWPAMLIGSDKNKQLPFYPAINNFLNLEGDKFSKSRGVVLYPEYVVENYGIDSLRYYLAKVMPENQDADWIWKDFVAANNNELVANFGNFVFRVLSFYKAHPELDPTKHILFAVDNTVQQEIKETFYEVGRLIEECKLAEALQRIMKLSSFGNKYFNDNEPWKVIKTSEMAASEAIYNCLTIIDNLRILLHPILPSAMNKLTRMLDYTDLIVPEVEINKWEYKPWNHEQKIEEFIEPLFKKFDEKEVLEKEKK